MKILVLEQDAESYALHLNDVEDNICYASSPINLDRDFDVLLARPDLAAAYLGDGGQVKWIQSTWAGVRPLADAVEDNSVLVTGIKEVFGAQIADYVFTYVLEELRHPSVYRAAQRQKRWRQELPGFTLNRHMVIVGTGSIGSHLASVAKAFGMHVSGVSQTGTHTSEFDRVVPVPELNEIVADADYVVLALPDTAATYRLCNAETFAAMRNRPLVFNVGRGSTLDHSALLQALRERRVRGAVLDVFDIEPLPADDPLWDNPGIVITPHIAAVSYPKDIAAIFLNNLAKYKGGKPLDYPIDLSRGY